MRERVEQLEESAQVRDAAVASIADLYAEARAAREELRHRGIDPETLQREDTERTAEPAAGTQPEPVGPEPAEPEREREPRVSPATSDPSRTPAEAAPAYEPRPRPEFELAEPEFAAAGPELAPAEAGEVLTSFADPYGEAVKTELAAEPEPAAASTQPVLPEPEPAPEPQASPATSEPPRTPVEIALGYEPQARPVFELAEPQPADAEPREVVPSFADLYRAAEAAQVNEARPPQEPQIAGLIEAAGMEQETGPARAGAEAGEVVSSFADLYRAAEAAQQGNEARQPHEPAPRMAGLPEAVRAERETEPELAGAAGREPEPERAGAEAGEIVPSFADLYRAAEAAQRGNGAQQQQGGLASWIADPLAASRAEQEAALRRLDEERGKRLEPTLDHTKVWVEPTLAEEHAATMQQEVTPEETPRRRRGSRDLTEQERWAAETQRLEREMREAQQRAAAIEAARQLDEGMHRSGR